MIRTLFAVLFLTSFAFGQDFPEKRNREIYLTFADFSPLNLHLKYKHQIGQRTYLKFGLVDLSASHRDIESGVGNGSSGLFYSGGLEIGIEFRKQLSEKFTIFHGPNLRYTYRYNKDRQKVPNMPEVELGTIGTDHLASVRYTVGVLFNLTPHLLLAAEINPSFNFTHGETRNISDTPTTLSSGNVFNFSLDSRGGLLSLVLRF